MKMPVVTLRAPERDFNAALEYIAARSEAGAVAWVKAFDRALAHLEDNGGSCPLAVENEFVDIEVRETLFKTRRGSIYRILFTTRENEVIILHLRGPGQDLVSAMEIRQPD